MAKKRKKPPRAAGSWMNQPQAPSPVQTVVHATKVTLPPSHKGAYDAMWAKTPVLANARAAAEAEGLNPLAVLYAVFSNMSAITGGMDVQVVGDPRDVERVYVLAAKLWNRNPGDGSS